MVKRIPWNKGLTKETDERVRHIANYKIGKSRPDMINNIFSIGHKQNKGSFKSNHIPWNKGKKYSKNYVIKHGIGLNENSRNGFEKHNNRNSEKRIQTILNTGGFKGRPKGMKHTDEAKLKIKQKRSKQIITEEHKNSISKGLKGKYIGKNSSGWRGGIAYSPYPSEFNKDLKKQIRQRDNYHCQECKYSEKTLGYKLSVHHIDYNKNNCKEQNLICLCRSCHSQTNWKRNDWEEYFQHKMEVI